MTEEKQKGFIGRVKDVFSPISSNEEPVVREKEMEIMDISNDAASLEKMVAATEKSVEFFKKIRIISLKLTNEKDWLLQGDGISPSESGMQKIGIAWGIDITLFDDPHLDWFQDDAGKYYVFTAKGKAFSRKLGRWIEDIGTCSSRDEFFGRVAGGWKQLETVDITDVKKKSVTNLYRRLISRCLGLSNITEDELKQAGLNITKIEKVEYGKDRKKAEAELPKEALDNRNMIHKIALILGNGSEEGAKVYIKEASKWLDAQKQEVFREDVRDIKTARWIETTLGRIKGIFKSNYPEDYAKMFPAANGQQQPAPAAKEGGKK
jgi:hypothetical protein